MDRRTAVHKQQATLQQNHHSYHSCHSHNTFQSEARLCNVGGHHHLPVAPACWNQNIEFGIIIQDSRSPTLAVRSGTGESVRQTGRPLQRQQDLMTRQPPSHLQVVVQCHNLQSMNQGVLMQQANSPHLGAGPRAARCRWPGRPAYRGRGSSFQP